MRARMTGRIGYPNENKLRKFRGDNDNRWAGSDEERVSDGGNSDMDGF